MKTKTRLAQVMLTLVVIAGGIGLAGAQTAWNQAVGIGGAVDIVSEPGTPNLFAVVQGTGAGIYRSTDGGHSFSLLKSFTTPYKLAVGLGARLWAGTSQGLYKTTNLTTWTAVTGGLPAGKSVNFVGRAGQGTKLWATVSSGTARGLYRSTNNGVSWTRVIVNAATRSVTDSSEVCGSGMVNNVFAGGILSPGGPSCTLLKSTDGGATFTCTSFPHIVNQVAVDCVAGSSTFTHLFVTSPEGTVAQSVRRSTDAGATFVNDGTGLTDVGATNTIDWTYDLPGVRVGTMYTGIFERSQGPAGTPWMQFSTEGLLDQRINRWAIFNHNGEYYPVVATPTGVFAFDDAECIPGGDPNSMCQ